MAPVVINNTVQVRLLWALDGVPFAVNVLHAIKDVGFLSPDQDSVNDLWTSINSMWGSAALRNNITTKVRLHQIGVRDLNTANNVEFLSPTGTTAGAATSELLPLNVAYCVTLRTDKAGPSFRGRVYLSGFGEGSSDSGLVSPTTGPNCKAFVEGVQAQLANHGLQLAVASRKRGESQPVTAVVNRDNRWDTQRRRIIPGI